jgi:hypothetical protein
MLCPQNINWLIKSMGICWGVGAKLAHVEKTEMYEKFV